MTDNLKPCPFCNSDPKLEGDDHWWYAVCRCGADGGADQTAKKAIEIWNTRPIEDALRAQLAEAQAENASLRSMMKSEAFEGLSTKQLIFIIHSMQDERATKCLEYETVIEKLKKDIERLKDVELDYQYIQLMDKR